MSNSNIYDIFIFIITYTICYLINIECRVTRVAFLIIHAV